MAHILRFLGGPHEQTQRLLPWYATGRINDKDRATVDAHLPHCADCRDDLETERRLRAEVAGLSFDADQGWQRLCSRLEASRPQQSGSETEREFQPRGQRGRALGLLIPAQAAVLAAAAVIFWGHSQGPVYRTLGAPGQKPKGNVVVTFRPDTSERDLRKLLKEADARLVDGPTAADAYVLQIPPAERERSLAGLKHNPSVILAAPIGGGP